MGTSVPCFIWDAFKLSFNESQFVSKRSYSSSQMLACFLYMKPHDIIINNQFLSIRCLQSSFRHPYKNV